VDGIETQTSHVASLDQFNTMFLYSKTLSMTSKLITVSMSSKTWTKSCLLQTETYVKHKINQDTVAINI